MSYWITGYIDNTAQAATVPTAGDAACEAEILQTRGASDLKIIGPDGIRLTLQDLERLIYSPDRTAL